MGPIETRKSRQKIAESIKLPKRNLEAPSLSIKKSFGIGKDEGRARNFLQNAHEWGSIFDFPRAKSSTKT